MTIIAMTREMGSLGKDVAEGLAQDLGLRLLYHEIVDSVAEKMHLPTNVITRFLQGKAGHIESLRADFRIRDNQLFKRRQVSQLREAFVANSRVAQV